MLLGLFLFSKPKQIIIAEYNSNYKSIYPKTNFVKFENKDFLIKDIYQYRLNLLNEIQFIGSEGLAVQKIGFFELFKTNENSEIPKYLKFRKLNKQIIYNSKTYTISEERKDTIISKIKEDKIILFVTE